MIPYKQLSVADIFEDSHTIFENNKHQLFSLLEQHIDLDEIIPITFYDHYESTGRNRKYPSKTFLWTLIIQRIFSIPTNQLLPTFLHYSRSLRHFYRFIKVPDASFKQDYLVVLQAVLNNLVDLTESICQTIDSTKADITIFDSSGIEIFVPKTI